MPQTSGMDLKLSRVARRIKAVDIAREMGVSRQRVAAIEALAVVPEEAVARYRAAVMSVTTVSDEAVAL
jgi:DNA-binding XRE family transcriptional regulator